MFLLSALFILNHNVDSTSYVDDIKPFFTETNLKQIISEPEKDFIWYF